MTPIEYYYKQCNTGLVLADDYQLAVLQHLQEIHKNLLQENQHRSSLFSLLRKPRSVQGLYMWGGVGIGKTFLMDCFYHSLPLTNKLRMHFHPFMRMIHQELKKHEGEKNPLEKIAKELANKTMLICFDEFFVSDIADAMLLAQLFNALFSQGVCLVATSNVKPDDLYLKGLQRQLFLPAIALIKEKTTVLHIPTITDYRLLHAKNSGFFYTPNNEAAIQKMEVHFRHYAQGLPVSCHPVEICGRMIPINKQAGEVIWFDFDKLCAVPRSQHDYLEIAHRYTTVFISNIPKISSNNIINLFIRLVDVFYDSRIRLIFSAAFPINEIYTQGYMLADYARVRSRLQEMQAENYLVRSVMKNQ